jgi:nitrous oxide reductase accessory protein NosL
MCDVCCLSRRRLLRLMLPGMLLLPALAPARAANDAANAANAASDASDAAAAQRPAGAPRLHLPKPGEHDACPVCGMFPARYYEWIATIVFTDGTAVHFDGAKDAFKFWLDMSKYDPKKHTQADVKAFGVTAYYSTEMIDAKKALYVIGSDVLGPMGHDLIPHPDMYDARAFMKDHHGKAIVRFEDIDERNFDRRLNDLRREIQNKEDELPEEALPPRVMEITSANAYPTATIVIVSNQITVDIQ